MIERSRNFTLVDDEGLYVDAISLADHPEPRPRRRVAHPRFAQSSS